MLRPKFTMRAWPVARSIFDAPLEREAMRERCSLCERSERADNKLDKTKIYFIYSNIFYIVIKRPSGAFFLARRCLACRARRGPLGGRFAKSKTPQRGFFNFGLNMRQVFGLNMRHEFWSQHETSFWSQHETSFAFGKTRPEGRAARGRPGNVWQIAWGPQAFVDRRET